MPIQDLGGDKPTDRPAPPPPPSFTPDLPPPPDVPPPPPPSFTPGSTPEPGPRPQPPSDTIQDLGGDKPTGQDTTVDEPPPPPPSFTPERPEPPASIEDQETRGPVILDHVPAYDQNTGGGALGCIPAAIGSVLGSWDQKGYDNLFGAEGWDVLKETKNVAEEINSTTHRNTYDPLVLNEEPSSGASIADFAQTSVSGPNDLEPMPAGWGSPSKIPEAVRGYASLKGYEFSAIWHNANPASSEAAWDVLTQEIDAKRPLLAGIDAGNGRTFDGVQDHRVPVVGYDERPDGHYYGFYPTGDGTEKEEDIIWAKFEPLPDLNGASGVPDAHGIKWGVADLYTIQPDPVFVDSPPEFPPLDLTLIA